MMRLAFSHQMQQCDQRTIETIGIPGIVLMENAGNGTVHHMTRHFGPLTGKRCSILCGPGNNGGDGLVIARRLAALGAQPDILLTVAPEKLHGDAAINLAICRALGLAMTEVGDERALLRNLPRLSTADLVIDALFGTGLSRRISGHFATLIGTVNQQQRPVIAVDIPSGINSDNGQILGCAVRAALTVTYGLAKPGHFLYPGRDLTASLEVVDIGIPAQVVDEAGINQQLLSGPMVRDLLPSRPADSHKGTFGHLLLVAGSTGKTGAALLAAQGAIRCGTGLVTMAAPHNCQAVFATGLPEAMTLPTSGSDCFIDQDLDLLQREGEMRKALVLGPGLGLDPRTAELVTGLYRDCPRPMVVDADGCNLLAQTNQPLATCAAPRILTPHPGEMRRLTGLAGNEIQADRIAVGRRFATDNQLTLVLKGAATVIAAADGRIAVNPTGNAGMATGGMGDVLAGIIGGLLAQGLEPFAAANAGVYLHGAAADRLGREKPCGYLASEVAAMVPEVMAGLSLRP